MNVVVDTGVVVAGIYWKSEPHRCLLAFARRQFSLAVSEPIFAEYAKVAWRLKHQEKLSIAPRPWLNFIRNKGKFTVPVPLDHPVCRDPKDDPFLECALAAGAGTIVSRDEDLLVLEKPFGIEIITPRQFLTRLKELEGAARRRRRARD